MIGTPGVNPCWETHLEVKRALLQLNGSFSKFREDIMSVVFAWGQGIGPDKFGAKSGLFYILECIHFYKTTVFFRIRDRVFQTIVYN